MPKKFHAPITTADPLCNIHPAAVESDVSTADRLCDLLFGGADQVVIGDFLRQEFDEPNGRAMAAWFCLMVEYLPAFRRAVHDGQDATLRRLEAEALLSTLRLSRPADFSVAGLTEHRRMIQDAEAEHRRCGLLEQSHDAATWGLHVIGVHARPLYEDPRSEQLADKPLSLAEIQTRRLALHNYPVDHKLELETVDGWSRSIRQLHGTAGRVVIRTVERVPKGLRLP